jgi:hypothetical protein
MEQLREPPLDTVGLDARQGRTTVARLYAGQPAVSTTRLIFQAHRRTD